MNKLSWRLCTIIPAKFQGLTTIDSPAVRFLHPHDRPYRTVNCFALSAKPTQAGIAEVL